MSKRLQNYDLASNEYLSEAWEKAAQVLENQELATMGPFKDETERNRTLAELNLWRSAFRVQMAGQGLDNIIRDYDSIGLRPKGKLKIEAFIKVLREPINVE